MPIHTGKAAVVTGGASGIGRGIVERLVADGARVVIADVDIAGAEAVAGELNAAGEPGAACEPGAVCVAVETDVRDEDSLRAAVDTCVSRFGGLDIMVNNAGIIAIQPITETDAEGWHRMLSVNVTGTALGTKVAARHMIAAGGGCIINASSGAGRHGAPNLSQYCATKAAIIMLSQSAAIELAPRGIRVNCYTPGHIMTPFWDGILAGMTEQTGRTRQEVLDGFLGTVPAGRFGTPADVAAAVSWLASDDASYVSGQCIAMNGAELPW
jgi:NAD(P)-dependent dehydrogenase (short-subunit alcohol dehydrogenase family)